MILYIHGFGSCGWGRKSLRLRRFFGTARLLAPDLPLTPDAAMNHLEGLLVRYPVTALVGASLGGFFATCLNAVEARPTILINPVVRPGELRGDFIGRHQRWCDDMPFSVDERYLRALNALQRNELNPDERYLVLLQKGDEVLDYRQAADFYRDQQVRVLTDGDHRFEDIDRHLPLIADWLRHQGAIAGSKPEKTT